MPWRNPFAAPGIKGALPILALILAIVLAYWQAPENGFHFDDEANIVDRAAIHLTELSLAGLWRAAREGLLPSRPLSNVSLAIDWWRGGGSAATFIRSNIVLHLLMALAVWSCVRRLLLLQGQPRAPALGLAWGAALLWALHPIQVQAVTYVVQRMAELSALFSLLSVLAYVRGRTERRPAWLVLSLATFLLSVAAKENGWITPALWWLAEFGCCRGQASKLLEHPASRLLFALPFLLLLYVVVDIASGQGPLAQSGMLSYRGRDFTMAERLLTQPRVIVFHLSQMIWPLPDRFSVEHDFLKSTGLFAPATTLAALLGLLAWCGIGLAALLHQRWRLAGFWLLWVPVTLVVESSVVPLEMVFEHRMYLPSVGLFGLAATLPTVWFPGTGHRKVALPLVLLVAIGLILATRERVEVWRDNASLYADAVRHAPNSGRAWNGLGAAQLQAGDIEAAERSLGRAMALDPALSAPPEKLGVIVLDRGERQKAGELLWRAVRLERSHSALNHLGEWMLQGDDVDGAVRAFSQAVVLAPWLPAYRWNLALALERQGNCAEAREQWQAYLERETDPAGLEEVRRHLEETGASSHCN